MPDSPATIAAAALALRSGLLTAADLVDRALQAIERFNPSTNAFITVDAEGARAAARAADEELTHGRDRGPLHGVPISVKDLIDIAGQPTTAASRVVQGRVAAHDAVVITRLREAGAVLIGKTNLHEFALGTTSEESAWGAVHHPRDASRSAGGSSGGSAAAVATGMGLASIGSDTGGSIRIPAAACGVVGLKPSFGEVPLHGVIPLSVSLDHVGPLARSVQDAAWLWAVLAGQPRQQSDRPPEPASIRLCRLTGYFSHLADDVRAPFERALSDLRHGGVVLDDGEIPHCETIMPAYVNLALPEAAHYHAIYRDQAGDYAPNVRARLEQGAAVPAIDYLSARETQHTLRLAVDAKLEDCDALVLATLPVVAPPLGAVDVLIDSGRGDRLPVRSAMLRQTQLFNLTGHPAISLPIHTSGWPVGLQLVGKTGQTARLLAVARAIEKIVCPEI